MACCIAVDVRSRPLADLRRQHLLHIASFRSPRAEGGPSVAVKLKRHIEVLSEPFVSKGIIRPVQSNDQCGSLSSCYGIVRICTFLDSASPYVHIRDGQTALASCSNPNR